MLTTSCMGATSEIGAVDDDAPHHTSPHEPDTKPGKKIKNVKEEEA
ncbi:Uncharacterised protein [Dermacoccus nishinomiyaensis]|nr:hypothetical protein EDC82_2406 [Dermacoccus sp. SAI-028]STD19888.1 Uncharacterised protein [Dermacoccus nishinomiyaensis]